MGQKEILELVKEDLKAVEESIVEHFQSEVAMIPTISGYLANGGGKRLRPMILLLTANLCGYNGGRGDILHSTVIEYIHAATLLHDDVIDSAEVRRGIASANAKWGNQYPVLVGDYLYAKSFSMMTKQGSLDIINAVSTATRYLAEGQVMELAFRRDLAITEDDYLELIFRKTGALITACCQIGAFLGKASETQQKAIERYGRNIGIAFQLIDDLLDFTSDEKTLGKPVGQDIAEGHITLPVIHSYRNATEGEKKLIEEIIGGENLKRGQLDEIIKLLKKYDGTGYTERMAQKYADEALKDLDCFAPGPYLEALKGTAEYIVNRTS